MVHASDSVVEAGVDYITATYVGRATESSLSAFGRFIVGEQAKQGEKERPFHFSGYRGYHAGGASYGVRHDGAIVRLSSQAASEHWAQTLNLCTNVTRLDVQVTVAPSDGPTERLARHHEELLAARPKRGRPAKFKFWYGPDGPEAAILGKRVSDWFGRAYDKGLESGLTEYRGTLRYEAETKRDVAHNLALGLDQSEAPSALILSTVSTFFSNRGCRLPAWSNSLEASDSASQSFPLVRRDKQVCVTDATVLLGQGAMRKRSLWLYNSVRPAVKALVDQGHRELVLELLGLSEAVGPAEKQPAMWRAEFDTWR